MNRRKSKYIEYVARARLIPGKDDDLIAWLESQPEGDVSQLIRDTLRAGIGQGSRDPVAMELNRLSKRVEEMSSKLSQGAMINGPSAQESLDNDQAKKRAAQIIKAKW